MGGGGLPVRRGRAGRVETQASSLTLRAFALVIGRVLSRLKHAGAVAFESAASGMVAGSRDSVASLRGRLGIPGLHVSVQGEFGQYVLVKTADEGAHVYLEKRGEDWHVFRLSCGDLPPGSEATILAAGLKETSLHPGRRLIVHIAEGDSKTWDLYRTRGAAARSPPGVAVRMAVRETHRAINLSAQSMTYQHVDDHLLIVVKFEHLSHREPASVAQPSNRSPKP